MEDVYALQVDENKTENKNLVALQTEPIGFIAEGSINSLITTPATKWIATGNWSMGVNNGNLSYFNTNMTWYNSNGTGAHSHEFLNFKVSGGKLISLLQPGNNISTLGTMDVGTNHRVVWKNVPSTILINGKKTITISVNDNTTNHHFASQPVLGVVGSFEQCADIPGPNMEVLSPCTSLNSPANNNNNKNSTFSSSPGQENVPQQPISSNPPASSTSPETANVSEPEVQLSITQSQPGSNASINSAGNLFTYENGTIGLKLTYPSNWLLKPGRVVNPSVEILAVLSPSTDNDSAFTMAVQRLEERQVTSVGEYANNTLDSYKQRISSFQPDLFNPNGALSTRPAYEIDGTYLDDHSLKRMLIEVGTIVNNKVFIFQFDAPELKSPDYLPAVGEMLHSLKINSSVQDTLGVPVNTNLEGQNQTQSTCRNITVASSDASGFEKDPKDYNPPEHAIDNDLQTWWSYKGVPSWFQISLAEPVSPCSVGVAWNKGDERTYDFTISTSDDGQSFTDVLTDKSSGKSLSYENYDLQNSTSSSISDVKFLKLGFTGSSSKVGWVGIRDIKVSGK